MIEFRIKYIKDRTAFSYSRSKYSPFKSCLNVACPYYNKEYREHCDMKVFPITCKDYKAFQNRELNNIYIEGQFYASNI